MKIIGLTGPTGAGKSILTATAQSLGFKVIDCDKVARQAVVKDSEGLKALVKVFGADILLENGELDRKALARKAFSSPDNTELLNKTLLPHITALVEKECDSEYVLLDAPTLIESGLNKKCDAVIGVLADREKRLHRICKRDNISREDANLRINAGKPDEFFKENCTVLIYNNGDSAEITEKFAEILTEIKER
ncbi:MAG: dephospho-CoA kinase [Clostridia bacterium]|nr:dephospho-CoA kinase [Clostridia bacterium]